MKKAMCVAALGIAAMLLLPSVSSAQRRGWGSGGRGWGNGSDRGWGGGVYVGGNGWYGGYSPYYSNGGYGYSPYYSNGGYGYSPSYTYGYSQPYYYGDTFSSPSYFSSPTLTGEETAETPDMGDRAFIQVRVPENAQLFFEGDQTNQTGAMRTFISPALQPNKTYTYEIRARWNDNSGQGMDRSRKVTVQAGRRTFVDFTSANGQQGDTNLRNDNLRNDNLRNDNLRNDNKRNDTTPRTDTPRNDTTPRNDNQKSNNEPLPKPSKPGGF